MFFVENGGDHTNITLFFQFIIRTIDVRQTKKLRRNGTGGVSNFICISLFKLHILHINLWV